MTMITKEQAQAWKSPKSSHGVHLNSGTLNEFCDAVIALHERVERLTEALLWCSGSNDFHEGGVARKGWMKLCAPLLKETTND